MPGRDGHGRSGSRRGTAELVSLAAALFLGLLSGLSAKAAESEKATPAHGASAQDIPVPAPPLSEGIFPCSGCHAGQKTNRQRRKLTEMHQDILLEHGPESRWCFDCHDPDDRDELARERGADRVLALLPALRTVRRRQVAGLEGGRSWEAGRRVEREEAVPALRPLPTTHTHHLSSP